MQAEGSILRTYQRAGGRKMGGQHGKQEAVDAVWLPSKALGSGPHLHNQIVIPKTKGGVITGVHTSSNELTQKTSGLRRGQLS